MRIYNAVGYGCLVSYAAASFFLAPEHLGPWAGLGIGMAYLIVCWFMAGVYLSCVIHMGIAHRALDYQEWFVKTLSVLNNTFGVYINPISWVNRHRLHHRYADHPGDPNKLAADGPWKTLWLCLFPYKTDVNVANDAILQTWPMRLAGNPVYFVVAQSASFVLLWWLVGDLLFASVLWVGTRIFAMWVNMVQNYWTHDRRWGYRRYEDDDNAMNIGDWLPVMATFSACLQNNHHHSPQFLRLSHVDSEFDFGFATVKVMKALGLVKASNYGAVLPKDIPLESLEF
ncbi:MAG TPA: fatty acid desaturase [Steroidobacteraceae bacterium]|nr:fatty acid desaturase [Steroidobacteraceae bacterium]